MRKLRDNIVLKTDSYKKAHPAMLPLGTTATNSHFGARKGGIFDAVIWNGLQPYMTTYLEGPVVTMEDIEEADDLLPWHMPGIGFPGRKGWLHIVKDLGGHLPLHIEAAPEGMLIPAGAMCYSVESTDKQVPWLPGHVESLLSKVWYPTAIGTHDWLTKLEFVKTLMAVGYDFQKAKAIAEFMLQDFGYRGSSSEETARIGGDAHLLNFRGSDTIEGIRHARFYYGAGHCGFSVAASQHENATARGRSGELSQALYTLAQFPRQIVSLVGDSYDYCHFVDMMIAEREAIDRLGVQLVIRPDSPLPGIATTPADVILWTLRRLAEKLPIKQTPGGQTITYYKVLYGDGMSRAQIKEAVWAVVKAGFSPECIVFGMGNGLLQDVHRDDFRFKYAASAQERDGVWVDTSKQPLDQTKASMGGRLALYDEWNGFVSLPVDARTLAPKVSRPVFHNGFVLAQDMWDTVVGRVDATLERAIKQEVLTPDLVRV